VSGIRQLRLVVHASEYEQAVHFFRDVLGAPVAEEYAGDDGAQVTILDVGRATLELSNDAQVELIDRVEVGRRVAPTFGSLWRWTTVRPVPVRRSQVERSRSRHPLARRGTP
jgi:catechol 2,3-dioxygenase-like lactoylglutathione lyase family enzyme